MLNTFKINFVNQVNDNSCAVACMAMVAGVSFAKALDVISDIGKPPLIDSVMLIGLCRLNVLPIRSHALEFGKIYIADVPSLNKKACLHSVVVDLRDCLEIYDPNKGRCDKEYYHNGMVFDCYSNLIECIRVFDRI